jgi:HPt (histidine-containing phosphotransfer) domain-containing protein
MIEDLHAKFLPQLLELARTRMANARDVAHRRDFEGAAASVRDLHALAGEAGLLGVPVLVPLARKCEDKAKQMRASRSDADADALASSLEELERAIDLVENNHRGGVRK